MYIQGAGIIDEIRIPHLAEKIIPLNDNTWLTHQTLEQV